MSKAKLLDALALVVVFSPIAVLLIAVIHKMTTLPLAEAAYKLGLSGLAIGSVALFLWAVMRVFND